MAKPSSSNGLSSRSQHRNPLARHASENLGSSGGWPPKNPGKIPTCLLINFKTVARRLRQKLNLQRSRYLRCLKARDGYQAVCLFMNRDERPLSAFLAIGLNELDAVSKGFNSTGFQVPRFPLAG